MRKILTASMVVGAAMLVAACGGTETAANNTAANDMGMDATYDANAADMSMDTNMSMDANATDLNLANDMNASTDADNTMTNSQ